MPEGDPKKSLGQHWLNDIYSLEAICQSASISDKDLILEIGPGPGALTKLLVKRAKRVVAVEYDAYWSNKLSAQINSDRLDVINQDILNFNFDSLPGEYKVVANIPYYLTSNLIRRLSEAKNPPVAATLLIQKEVAERIATEPGDMSLLSVTAQYYWSVKLGDIVPAGAFTPSPKVDSQIITLSYRQKQLYKDIDVKKYFRLVKAGFSQKRKTLLNSLSAGLRMDKEQINEICLTSGIDPKRRAQTLSLDEWYKLYSNINH